MALPLRYSFQPSLLKQEGETQAYGRLQVDYRPKLENITLSNAEYQRIVNAVAEGRALGLVSESGTPIGQFMPTLQGGFVISEFVQAAKKDFRVSFSPNKKLLADAREIIFFEQIPTVVNDPIITFTTFTYYEGTGRTQVEKVLTNQIKIDTAGILRISGTQFLKDGMQAQVTQNGVTSLFINMSNSGTKFSEIMINADAFPAANWSPQTAVLTTWRTDNTTRRADVNIAIVN